MKQIPQSSKSYWRANLSLTFKVLIIWFSVSFGCGIIFKEELDKFSLGGAPFGFGWLNKVQLYALLFC